jgi:methylthioribulose-1-phosphate dehydratase
MSAAAVAIPPAINPDGFERPLDRAAWPEIAALRRVGADFHRRGWSLGTSSNYSVVLGRDPLRLLVTASGKDKSRLASDDFVVVDVAGKQLDAKDPKPSAETPLHCILAAKLPNVGAVLHTHSIWGTVLSDCFADQHGFILSGYEMLKGLHGVATHEQTERIAVLENTQEIPKLAAAVARRIDEQDSSIKHGYLIRRHGLYTWGRDLEEAVRQIEIFEFLFEVAGRSLSMPNFTPPGVRSF